MKEASWSLFPVFLRKKIDGLVCQSDSGKNNLSDDLMFGTQRSELRTLKVGQH